MKISEMTNDQATEAMIRLAEPFQHICEDDEMQELMESLLIKEDEPVIKQLGRMIPKFVLYALKKHKQDLYEIIGALSMTPTGSVGSANFRDTVNVLKNSYDEILKDFFTSSVPVQQMTES